MYIGIESYTQTFLSFWYNASNIFGKSYFSLKLQISEMWLIQVD